MGDQEMQFADPAWQPPQQRGLNMATHQQEPLPQPVNVGTYEQAQWQDASSSQQSEEPYGHIGSYTEGYRAQSSSGIPLRTGQQKRRSPWLWIVLALIIFSLLGGAFRMDRPYDIPHSYSFPHMRMSDHFKPDGNAQQYSVGIHPTIVINDPNGSITVNTGGLSNSVTVQTPGRDQESVPSATFNSSEDSLQIAVDNSQWSQTDLEVTVSDEADLVIRTNSGDIDVTGVNGQLNLNSDSGTITLSQVYLAGNSSVSTNSGDIGFDGGIAPNGSYQFQSGSGSVDVTLPPDTSFHAAVTPNSGSFNSDFPEVHSQPSGGTIDGDVGNSPSANVMIKTDSGSINLNKGS
jgi:hypothetical protein